MASEHGSFSYVFNYCEVVTLVSIIGAKHYAADRLLAILFVVASKQNRADDYESKTFSLAKCH